MDNGKIKFGIGLGVGIILAAFFFLYFAPRYETMESSGMVVKQDRWSGDTWRLVNNEWKKIKDVKRDWARIDQMLRQALNLPNNEKERDKALNELRTKYPALVEVSDDEILERIKFVYSREIMNELYLKNFLKIQAGKK